MFDISTSTESFEMAVNTSDSSLPRREPAASRRTKPKHRIVLADNLSSSSLSTTLPGDPTKPPPLLASWHEPEPEPQSAPPRRIKRFRDWLRAYRYEDRKTPKQPATLLPLPEYSNPNSSVTSIGVSTHSYTSSESLVTTPDVSAAFLPSRSSLMLVPNGSLETIGNLSAPSIYTLAEEGSIDSGYLPTEQVELPAADTLSTTPPSSPPTSLLVTTPSPLPARDRELLLEPLGLTDIDYLPTSQAELLGADTLSTTPPLERSGSPQSGEWK